MPGFAIQLNMEILLSRCVNRHSAGYIGIQFPPLLVDTLENTLGFEIVHGIFHGFPGKTFIQPGNRIGCIFASLLFGLLNVIGTTMGRLPGTSIPASIIDLLQGIVMVCVIASYAVRRIVEYRREKKLLQKEGV